MEKPEFQARGDPTPEPTLGKLDCFFEYKVQVGSDWLLNREDRKLTEGRSMKVEQK